MPGLVVGAFLKAQGVHSLTRAIVVIALWIGFAVLDALAFSRHDQLLGAFAAYLVAFGFSVALSIAFVKLMQRLRLAEIWQAVAGIAAGILALLPFPRFVVGFYCAFTGVCP